MNRTTRLFVGIALGAFVFGNAALTANSQDKQTAEERALIEHKLSVHGPTSPPGDFVFVSSDMGYDGKRVTGAPYTAQAVTESTQALADGNRIVRKSSAMLYRDSEGRTRRELSFKAIGPLAADGDPGQTIFISDPVAGVDYTLDTRSNSARKMMPMRFKFEMKTPPPSGDKAGMVYEKQAADRIHIERSVVSSKIATGGPMIMEWHGAREGKAKKESLGKQLIEGVEAEGTRSTLTIPAGEIGNERAIEIVSERWYSPELQTVVMTRHSDPRFGETTYKLTNIIRTEPDRSLFELPAGYTLKEETMKPRVRAKRPASEQ
jgi:hypothetical protein